MIITEHLEIRKVCVKMDPRLLNDVRKDRRVQMCEDILEKLETEPDLLSRVFTCDDLWIFQYNPITKHQSRDGTGQDFLDPTRPVNFKIIAG